MTLLRKRITAVFLLLILSLCYSLATYALPYDYISEQSEHINSEYVISLAQKYFPEYLTNINQCLPATNSESLFSSSPLPSHDIYAVKDTDTGDTLIYQQQSNGSIYLSLLYDYEWKDVTSSTGSGYRTFNGSLYVVDYLSGLGVGIQNIAYTMVQNGYDYFTNFGQSASLFFELTGSQRSETSTSPAYIQYGYYDLTQNKYTLFVEVRLSNEEAIVYVNGTRP